MNRLCAISLIIFILPLSVINAETSLNSELTRCAAIKRDLQRLACYDSLSGMASSSPVEALSKKSSESIAKNAIETSVTKPASSTASQSENDFGIQKQYDGPESISSYIPGEFKGWNTGDIITLANGQVWEIKNANGRLYHIATNPKVTISIGMFDSFHINIEGVNKSATVIRVK